MPGISLWATLKGRDFISFASALMLTHCWAYQGQTSSECAKTESELKTEGGGGDQKKEPLSLAMFEPLLGALTVECRQGCPQRGDR